MNNSTKKVILFATISIALLGLIIYSNNYFSRGGNGKNLILISIDTLRADRLGVYGYNRNTSPAIDAFASKSVLFEKPISVSSWTLPSHASIFTALYPTTHGVNDDQGVRIHDNTQIFTEILKEHGYATFAHVSGGYVGARYGFNRAFDNYHMDKGKKRLGHYDMIDALEFAFKEIPKVPKDKPYFFFLHTFDVHCPYIQPKGYAEMFKSEDSEYIDPAYCGSTLYNKININPAQVKYISDRYDASIRWVDDGIGKLLKFLEERGDLKNTVIVITSDHGDEFHEHGQIGHKDSLHKELIFVPLIIYDPEIKPTRVRPSVSLVDIAPTILDLLELPEMERPDGESLLPLINGERADLRSFQLSEVTRGKPLRSSIDDKSHYIKELDTDAVLYYDLINDPLERKNISSEAKEAVKLKDQELENFIRNLKPQEPGVAEKRQTKQEIEKLRSLGYLD